MEVLADENFEGDASGRRWKTGEPENKRHIYEKTYGIHGKEKVGRAKRIEAHGNKRKFLLSHVLVHLLFFVSTLGSVSSKNKHITKHALRF